MSNDLFDGFLPRPARTLRSEVNAGLTGTNATVVITDEYEPYVREEPDPGEFGFPPIHTLTPQPEEPEAEAEPEPADTRQVFFPEFGQRVFANYLFRKKLVETGHEWAEKPKDIHGIFLGYRTIYKGYCEYYGSAFKQTGHYHAALVCQNSKTNPIYVPRHALRLGE
jgi:hypothetical protein